MARRGFASSTGSRGEPSSLSRPALLSTSIAQPSLACSIICACIYHMRARLQEDDFADDLADDEPEGGDENPVAAGDDGGGGGAEPEKERPMDKNNPFHKDPESYSIFSSITDGRYQKKIKAIATELHDFAEEHQTLLRQRLTYEELLQGMMYPGERATCSPPSFSPPSALCAALPRDEALT